jgi:hypothetical protein
MILRVPAGCSRFFKTNTSEILWMIRCELGLNLKLLILHDISISVPNHCINANVFETERVFLYTYCRTFFILCNIFLLSDIFARNGGNKCIFL